MPKQLNVNLAFTADTAQAKAQLLDLQKSLKELSVNGIQNISSTKLTSDIQKATQAATQLGIQLKNATNASTGNLDLTKFNQSMLKSGMSLKKYQDQLYQLGPAGEKAFIDLSRAITLAEIPLRRTSKLASGLWTTLKNTARWQLSSTALHAFMGSMQSAYSYAKNLNESLNNIRIVTGQNAEQMAAFAKNANNAAKALSTTTTAYTNAALIYYQQGDNKNQVLEKTDVTTKMANVTGQSAEVVSNQLTAIWNNFNKEGDVAYEHYADVLTALGAATASSTDEIAGGLEKFASIADMIGLSYEYAASALATITATTRQSEDVVGTALKTIFARIQGLKLGETLEDGTSLNKYSEALMNVGISIKNQNGELKQMDNILNEMGAKWGSLSKDQQVALAQTVAGVRQYNQLVSLMDNWDFMQENLDIANSSTGTLQNQANIYAESWEGASKRARAAMEDIYDSILNDEFFIDLTNGFAKVLDGLGAFIDGMGGAKGLLLSLGAIATRVFNKQISQGLSNMATSLRLLTPNGRKAEQNLKIQANEAVIQGAKDVGTTSGGYRAEAYSALAKNQLAYLNNNQKMSEEELAINQTLLDRNRILADDVVKKGESVEQSEKELNTLRNSLKIGAQLQAQSSHKKNPKTAANLVDYQSRNYLQAGKSEQVLLNLMNKTTDTIKDGSIQGSEAQQKFNNSIKETLSTMANFSKGDSFQKKINKIAKSLGLSKEEAEKSKGAIKDLLNSLNSDDPKDLKTLRNALSDLALKSGEAAQNALPKLKQALMDCGFSADEADKQITEYQSAVQQFGKNSQQAQEALDKMNKTLDEHNRKMAEMQKKPLQMSQAFTTAAGAMMAFGQVINQVKGIISVFNDEQATTGEQITALIMGVGMLIPAISAIGPAFSTAKVGVKLFGMASVEAGTAASLAMWHVTLIVMGITAAIAILIKTVQYLRSTSPKGELENAKKASDELKESLDGTKKAADDLRRSFESYETAREKLSKCSTGTKEWTSALKEANDAALEVVSNLPSNWSADQIKSSYSRDESTGMLKLNEDIIKQGQEEADRKTRDALYASQVGQISVKQAQNNLDSYEIAKDIYNKSYTVSDSGDAYNTQGGKTAGDISQLIQENLDILTKAITESDFEEALKEIGIDTSVLGDDLTSLQDRVRTLGDSVEAAAAQADLFAQVQVDAELGEKYDAATKNIVAAGLDKKTEDLEQQYLGALTNGADGNAKFANLYGNLNKADNGSEESFQKFLADYNAITGKNWSASSNAVQGSDENRVFEFFDEDGKIRTLRAEQIAAEMAAAEALNSLTEDAKTAAAQLSQLGKTEQGEDLKEFFATNSFDHLTESDLLADFGVSAGGEVSKESAIEFLKKSYGVKTDEGLRNIAAGLNMSLEDLVDKVAEGATQTAKGFATIGEDLSKTPKAVFEHIDTGEMTAEGKKKIAGALQKVFNEGGKDSADVFKNILNKINKEDMEEFAQSIDKIDWQDASVESVRTQLDKLGISTNIISDEDLPQLIAIMQESSEISLISAQNFHAALQGIKKDLDGDLSVIDEDAYNTLKEAGIATEAYFTQLADGTYQLTSDAEDFKTLVNEISFKPLYESMEAANNKAATLYQASQFNGDITAATTDTDIQKQQLQVLEASGQVDATDMQELWASYNETSKGEGIIYDSRWETVGNEIADKMAEVNINSENASEIINQNLTEAAQQAGEIQKSIEETQFRNDVEKYGLNLEETSDHAKRLATEMANGQEVTDDMLKTARQMSIANQRMNRGIGDINKNLTNYKKILKSSDKDTLEYSKTMNEFKGSLADVFNVTDGDMFSDTFAQAMLDSEDFAKALNGDEEALNRLRVAATTDLGDNIITQLDRSSEEAISKANVASAAWDAIKGVLEGGFTMEDINNESFVTSLNEMIAASGMTKDQITSMLGSMGVDAKIKTDYTEMPTEVPTYVDVSEPSEPVQYQVGTTSEGDPIWGQTQGVKHYTVPGEPIQVMGFVPTYSIETSSGDTTSGGKIDYSKTFTKISPGTISPSSTQTGGGKGGGGGSNKKPKKAKSVKKSEVVERYKEINDSLDNLSDSLNKANKAADRLYGGARLKEMQRANSIIKDEIALLGDKAALAKEQYLPKDKAALEAAAQAAGIHFNINGSGDISNYTSEMEKLYNQLDSAINSANADGNADEAEQEKIDKIQEKIDKVKEALDTYEETKELIEDLDNEIQEKFYQWQDNNFEMLNYKLELKIQVNDNELKELDYHFNKIANDFYKSAEAFGLLFGENGEASKLGNVKQALVDQADASQALESAYKAGEISQAAYIEGLQSCYDEIYNNLEALQDLDEEMINYYGETLSKASDEIAKYTDQMDHLTGVLDHYRNIMSLLGRDKDYKSMLTLLEGSAKTQKNNYEASKSKYNMLKEQEALVKADYLKDPENEVFKKKMEDITAALREAEEEMLSDAEAYGESLKVILTTKMEEAAHDMEMALTDGIGFDALSDSLSRLSAHQDEYLTKTNRTYELNKLLNKIAQDSDKTNNQVSKNKYAAFAKEIEALKEANMLGDENAELSNLELEIAQAKYKQLQAQMALEDARNNKTTMRLVRNDSGNYDYVYTASEEAINQAEQDLADAENDLYNIRLEATNEYGEKKIQAERDFAQKLAEIDQKAAEDAIYREGAYQAERDAIVKEYTTLITSYSNLYKIASQEDSKVVQDAWVNTYDKIIKDEITWDSETKKYSGEVQGALTEWSEKANELAGLVGKDFEGVKEKTDAVTEASNLLKDKLIDEVMPAISDQLTEVNSLTSAYGYQRSEIQALIDKYVGLARSIKDTIAAEAQLAASQNSGPKNPPRTPSKGSSSNNTNSTEEEAKALASEAQELVQKVHFGEIGHGGAWIQDAKNHGYSQQAIDLALKAFNDSKAGGGYSYYYDEALRLVGSYDTGGYTGSWGTNGKLALLHEKELVLNKEDTENILSAINLMHSIGPNMINQIKEFLNNNMIKNNLFNLTIPQMRRKEDNQIVEQNVIIQADFPGVSAAVEIEEALNNLINDTVQYASINNY